MKRTETYHYLRALVLDIEKQSADSLAFQAFHAEKIRRFHDQNRTRINVMNDKIQSLIEAYVEKEDGKYATVEVGERKEWKFKTDADREAYRQAYAAFMDMHIDVFL